jgi:hypothetical protein
MGETGAVMDGWSRLYSLNEGDFSYFQLFAPVARAGHSIWIYRLTAEDWERVFSLGWEPIEQP